MTLETVTVDKVAAVVQRSNLVRVVADGDLITASVDGNVLGVFQVNWTPHRDGLVATLRSVGGGEAISIHNADGVEVVDGLRIALPLPRRAGDPARRRSLLFTAEPSIRLQHDKGEPHA